MTDKKAGSTGTAQEAADHLPEGSFFPAVTVLWLLLAFFISGCPSAYARSESEPDRVVLQLKWLHQFQFAGYYVAQANGFYRDAGIEVDIREGRPGMNFAEEVWSGRADFGVENAGLIVSHGRGKRLSVLAAIMQHSPLVIGVKAAGDILSPQDLAGRRVMYHQDRDAEINAMLLSEGVPLESIIHLRHSWRLEEFLSGEAEALSLYLTSQVWELKEAGVAMRYIQPRAYGIDFYGDCLFTSQRLAKEDPDLVRRFRDASLKGWEAAMRQPDAAIDILLRDYGSLLSRRHLMFEASVMRDLMQLDTVPLGTMNPGRWRSVWEVFRRAGVLEGAPDLDGFLFDFEEEPAAYSFGVAAALLLCGGLLAGGGVALLVSRRRRRADWRLAELEEENGKLLDRMERFELMLSGSRDGLWDWNIETGEVHVCPGWLAMLGMKAEDFQGDGHAWMQSVHPDDRAMVSRSLDACIRGEEDEFREEFRVCRSPEGCLWVLSRAGVVRRNGSAVRMVGVHMDVTARKEAEQVLQSTVAGLESRVLELSEEAEAARHALRREENDRLEAENRCGDAESFCRAASEASHDAQIRVDGRQRITFWNAAAERIFGWKREDARLRPVIPFIVALPDREAVRSAFRETAARGVSADRHIYFEAMTRRGAQVPVEAVILPFEMRGERMAVWSLRDLSELRRNEERLKELAIRDSATGLFIGRHFLETGETEVTRARRFGQPLSLVAIDLEKQESPGTRGLSWEASVRALADICLHETREVDIAASLGSGEVVLLLPGTDMDGARVLADRIGRRAGEVLSSESRMRCGIAGLNAGWKGVEELVDAAVSALRHAGGSDSFSVVMSGE